MKTPPIPLAPDETLLWMGHSQKPIMTAKDVVTCILPGLLLLWGWLHLVAGVSLPVELPAEVYDFAQDAFVPWLILLFAIALPAKPFIVHAMLKRTTYIFTDKRAVEFFCGCVQFEVAAAEIPSMSLVRHGKGLVSLRKWTVVQSSQGTVNTRSGFEYIPEDVPEYYSSGK